MNSKPRVFGQRVAGMETVADIEDAIFEALKKAGGSMNQKRAGEDRKGCRHSGGDKPHSHGGGTHGANDETESQNRSTGSNHL